MEVAHQNIPGPSAFKALHHLRRMRQAPADLFSSLHEQYGDLVTFRVAHKRFYVSRHPEHARYFLTTGAANFPQDRFVFRQIEPVTGKRGLVQLQGEAWEQVRKQTAPLFKQESLAGFMPVIEDGAHALCAEMAQKSRLTGVVAANDIVLEQVFRITSRILFSCDLLEKAPEMVSQFLDLNRQCGLRLRSGFALPSMKLRRTRRKLNQAFLELLRDGASEKNDLLSLIGASQGPSAADQLSTFLFAGHETTAISILWTLYLMAKHPETQKRVLEEVKDFEDGVLTPKKVMGARFLLAVYQESLRLYPPAWILAREVSCADSIGGFYLRANSSLIINLQALHRHPSYWEKPDTFLPERFLGLPPGDKLNYTFLPFGGGKKICSGLPLAYLEALTILGTIVKRFSFAGAKQVKVQEMITSHPKDPILLSLRPRGLPC